MTRECVFTDITTYIVEIQSTLTLETDPKISKKAVLVYGVRETTYGFLSFGVIAANWRITDSRLASLFSLTILFKKVNAFKLSDHRLRTFNYPVVSDHNSTGMAIYQY